MFFARLVPSGALALDPAPALSKHWRAGQAGRLAATMLLAAVLAFLFLVAMRTAVLVPLARWMIH
jgi:hypothetical protein